MNLDSIYVDDCVGIFDNNLRKVNVVIFPNPFTTSTTLSYELNQPDEVSMSIYDTWGSWSTRLHSPESGINGRIRIQEKYTTHSPLLLRGLINS